MTPDNKTVMMDICLPMTPDDKTDRMGSLPMTHDKTITMGALPILTHYKKNTDSHFVSVDTLLILTLGGLNKKVAFKIDTDSKCKHYYFETVGTKF